MEPRRLAARLRPKPPRRQRLAKVSYRRRCAALKGGARNEGFDSQIGSGTRRGKLPLAGSHLSR